jgi:hypothetical protein
MKRIVDEVPSSVNAVRVWQASREWIFWPKLTGLIRGIDCFGYGKMKDTAASLTAF